MDRRGLARMNPRSLMREACGWRPSVCSLVMKLVQESFFQPNIELLSTHVHTGVSTNRDPQPISTNEFWVKMSFFQQIWVVSLWSPYVLVHCYTPIPSHTHTHLQPLGTLPSLILPPAQSRRSTGPCHPTAFHSRGLGRNSHWETPNRMNPNTPCMPYLPTLGKFGGQ